ncbi:MAG TPA: glucose-6-phosphate isomerase, partial [Burkholderiales bacterium]|nr:glucose-6-phosphate isomerase [Burkholderiales bacterium]
MTGSPTRLRAWQALQDHHRVAAARHLRELLADPQRFAKYSFACGDILFDFSKHRIADDTLDLLIALAQECDVPGWIARLFAGERVNTTEHRAA